jgi:hypothetical protein
LLIQNHHLIKPAELYTISLPKKSGLFVAKSPKTAGLAGGVFSPPFHGGLQT